MISEYLKSSTKQNVEGDIYDSTSVASIHFTHVSVVLRGISRGMMRVISFDTAIYSEVAGNKAATLQALSIVLLSASAAAVPAYFDVRSAGLNGIVPQMFLAVVAWVLWVSITYFVGTQIFRQGAPERDWKALARALGFAQSAGILRIFAVIPGLGAALTLVILAWIFIASILAIRGALEIESTWRVMGIVAIGLIPFVPMMAFLNLLVVGS